MTSNADQPINEPTDSAADSTTDSATGETADAQSANGFGWFGFGLGTAAFLSSLTTAWTGAFLIAVFGMVLAANGLVRSYRKRATNGRYALIGLVLAVTTLVLAFVWSVRAEPCRPLQAEPAKWDTCYAEHTGLF